MDNNDLILRNKYLNNPICKLDDEYKDERGRIIPIVDADMKSCVLIESKKGSVRANHYHKTDWHFCYVLSGEIDYYFKETNSAEEKKMVTVVQGQCFFTPPMVDHAMVFKKDTTFVCLGRNPRDQKSYEADIERVELYV